MTEPSPRPSSGFRGELRDAISVRTVVLVVGVLFLQLGFILSYVGAFHAPEPHRIPVAVVAPAGQAPRIVAQLNAIPDSPVHAHVSASETAARSEIHDASTSAALIVQPAARSDRLLVASGGGAPVVTAVTEVIQRAEAQQQRPVTVVDIVALQPGDARGLTGFYLVIGWIVGGYLVAALLGIAKGERPANLRRAVIRLCALVPYALASGFGGTLIVDQVLGALTGHFWALSWLGVLLVLAAGTITMAFETFFGVLGIGITVLVFVVLGNPSAGGAYQTSLLPPFWRAISGLLPNGAGVDSVRRIVYFGANGIGVHLLVITIYIVVGVVGTLVGSSRIRERVPRRKDAAASDAAV